MPGSHKEPPPPPTPRSARQTKQAAPQRELEVSDSDVINVVIGVDEEKAHARKRQHEHTPPVEPGVPRRVEPESPDAPMTVAPEQNVLEDEEDEQVRRMDGEGGSVEKAIGTADTARLAGDSDIESDSTDDTVNLRKPRI